MYNLLQNHGSRSILHTPDGLKELLADIAREVLRAQPDLLLDFISRYLWALLATREHLARTVRLHTILNKVSEPGVEDVFDATVHNMGVPELTARLQQHGVKRDHAMLLAKIVDTEMKDFDDEVVLQERRLMKLILNSVSLDALSVNAVCVLLRDIFVEYQRRNSAIKAASVFNSGESWDIAASKTLKLYAANRLTEEQIVKACVTIQAAYRGYIVRKYLKSITEAAIKSSSDLNKKKKLSCKCHEDKHT